MRVRATGGELVAAVSGLALLASMFLPWYGTKHVVAETGFALPARDVTIDAWQSLTVIDVLLALAALAALASVVLAATRSDLNLRAALSLLTLATGCIATALVLYRVLVPLSSVEREAGLFVALAAAAGLAAGGFVWARNEGATVDDARDQLGRAIGGQRGESVA